MKLSGNLHDKDANGKLKKRSDRKNASVRGKSTYSTVEYVVMQDNADANPTMKNKTKNERKAVNTRWRHLTSPLLLV